MRRHTDRHTTHTHTYTFMYTYVHDYIHAYIHGDTCTDTGKITFMHAYTQLHKLHTFEMYRWEEVQSAL